MQIRGEIVIDRPVDEVFDFVADERNEPLYNPRMTRAEKVSPGPIGQGTRFSAEMTSLGRPAKMTIEFTDYERPRQLASSTQLSSMDVRGTLLFDSVPTGTRMTWQWQLEPRGALKLMTPIIGWMGQRQEHAIWAGLKRCLEARPAAPPAGL